MVLGVETGRELWGRRRIRIGFAKEQEGLVEVGTDGWVDG